MSSVAMSLSDLNLKEDMFNEELIVRVCESLKTFNMDLDEDLESRQRSDKYLDVLRQLLRNPKVNAISRTLIMEVIELRASKGEDRGLIHGYYRQKLQHLWTKHSSVVSINGQKTSHSDDVFGSNGVNPGFKSWSTTQSMAKTKDVVNRNSDSGEGIQGKVNFENIISNGNEKKSISVGANGRVVQMAPPTRDNMKGAKHLTLKLVNSSPVPFKSQNQTNYSIKPENNENQNQSIGLKAKQVLQQYMAGSDSVDNSLNEQNETKCKTVSNGKQMPSQDSTHLTTKLRSFDTKTQESNAEQRVPIGRTSLRFMNTKQVKCGFDLSEPKTKSRIVFDRQFLMSFAEVPINGLKPNFEMMSCLYSNAFDIIRKDINHSMV